MTSQAIVLPEISGPYTVFMADLHLPGTPSPLTNLFIDIMNSAWMKNADAFYLLGDLFDFWLGDDLLDYPQYQVILSPIRSLVDTGIKGYFQSGNRDFLVGGRFFQESGLISLEDPHRMDLYGVSTLLSHGDILCTADRYYQHFRRLTRISWLQKLFLSLPFSFREAQYQNIASLFGQHKTQKTDQQKDVELKTVKQHAQRLETDQIIHGHTHLPAIHQQEFPCRGVIPDWRMTDQEVMGGLLVATPSQQMIYTFNRSI